jgi:hypothetical protein
MKNKEYSLEMYQRLLNKKVNLPELDKFSNDGEFPFPHIPPGKIKAIVLGADPTNPAANKIEYVFDLNTNVSKRNRQYSWIIEYNLKSIGLTWDQVYVQNLCRNYFLKETSKQKRNWLLASGEWVKELRHELDVVREIPPNIPVLATTYFIIMALIKSPGIYQDPATYYRNGFIKYVPIPPDHCELNRPLIPLYRSTKYYLSNEKRKAYREYISMLIK